nr:MAG TPA: hypothetical protein [Bacteriophage sp.]
MAKSVASDYARTYTTFSGCDIVATFGNVVIGALQAITYHVQREKAPVYTMGSAEPRSFSRGKRGIAGTLVFTIFDKDALIDALADEVLEEESFHRIGGDISQQAISIDEWDEQMTKMAVDGNTPASTNSETITNNIAPASRPVYDDEIPPFDITISFANEYGQKASLVLYGVEILNEGSGFSIDNVTSEKACTFVARRVKYLAPVDVSGTPQSIGADAVSTSTSNSASSTNTKNSNVTSAGTSYSNGSIV